MVSIQYYIITFLCLFMLQVRTKREEKQRDICGTDSLGSDRNPPSISNLYAFCFCVRHVVSLFPEDVQRKVYVIDPLISGLLLDDSVYFLNLLGWFRVADFDHARLLCIAYNQS